ELLDINLREIVPFINWRYFFRAWKLTGKYEGIEELCDCPSCKTGWLQKFSPEEKDKAEEALSLYRDAQQILFSFLNEKTVKINAVFSILPAYSRENDIYIKVGDKEISIPTLRQQQASSDGFCYSLADFLASENDYIGLFATTVSHSEELTKNHEQDNDIYHSFLIKTLADRLAEASAEWLHFQIRKKYWGYNPDEELDVRNILKTHYPGIRPAIGYPSLPDQSVIFKVDKILQLNKIGVTLTENGAMIPHASVCGLYFAHPQSKYFMIGKIDENQLNSYASRNGKTSDEMRKWLVSNL
ncbi:methionine synthase, partial [Paludibacteraceae bacterium OttesenSCG-928-F17]|nr:methionine synthase [Paludibacteraceae bacterium OttesenSCG-928-F17]